MSGWWGLLPIQCIDVAFVVRFEEVEYQYWAWLSWLTTRREVHTTTTTGTVSFELFRLLLHTFNAIGSCVGGRMRLACCPVPWWAPVMAHEANPMNKTYPCQFIQSICQSNLPRIRQKYNHQHPHSWPAESSHRLGLQQRLWSMPQTWNKLQWALVHDLTEHILLCCPLFFCGVMIWKKSLKLRTLTFKWTLHHFLNLVLSSPKPHESKDVLGEVETDTTRGAVIHMARGRWSTLSIRQADDFLSSSSELSSSKPWMPVLWKCEF